MENSVLLVPALALCWAFFISFSSWQDWHLHLWWLNQPQRLKWSLWGLIRPTDWMDNRPEIIHNILFWCTDLVKLDHRTLHWSSLHHHMKPSSSLIDIEGPLVCVCVLNSAWARHEYLICYLIFSSFPVCWCTMVSRVASLGIHSFRGPPFLSRDTGTWGLLRPQLWCCLSCAQIVL